MLDWRFLSIIFGSPLAERRKQREEEEEEEKREIYSKQEGKKAKRRKILSFVEKILPFCTGLYLFGKKILTTTTCPGFPANELWRFFAVRTQKRGEKRKTENKLGENL